MANYQYQPGLEIRENYITQQLDFSVSYPYITQSSINENNELYLDVNKEQDYCRWPIEFHVFYTLNGCPNTENFYKKFDEKTGEYRYYLKTKKVTKTVPERYYFMKETKSTSVNYKIPESTISYDVPADDTSFVCLNYYQKPKLPQQPSNANNAGMPTDDTDTGKSQFAWFKNGGDHCIFRAGGDLTQNSAHFNKFKSGNFHNQRTGLYDMDKGGQIPDYYWGKTTGKDFVDPDSINLDNIFAYTVMIVPEPEIKGTNVIGYHYTTVMSNFKITQSNLGYFLPLNKTKFPTLPTSVTGYYRSNNGQNIGQFNHYISNNVESSQYYGSAITQAATIDENQKLKRNTKLSNSTPYLTYQFYRFYGFSDSKFYLTSKDTNAQYIYDGWESGNAYTCYNQIPYTQQNSLFEPMTCYAELSPLYVPWSQNADGSEKWDIEHYVVGPAVKYSGSDLVTEFQLSAGINYIKVVDNEFYVNFLQHSNTMVDSTTHELLNWKKDGQENTVKLSYKYRSNCFDNEKNPKKIKLYSRLYYYANPDDATSKINQKGSVQEGEYYIYDTYSNQFGQMLYNISTELHKETYGWLNPIDLNENKKKNNISVNIQCKVTNVKSPYIQDFGPDNIVTENDTPTEWYQIGPITIDDNSLFNDFSCWITTEFPGHTKETETATSTDKVIYTSHPSYGTVKQTPSFGTAQITVTEGYNGTTEIGLKQLWEAIEPSTKPTNLQYLELQWKRYTIEKNQTITEDTPANAEGIIEFKDPNNLTATLFPKPETPSGYKTIYKCTVIAHCRLTFDTVMTQTIENTSGTLAIIPNINITPSSIDFTLNNIHKGFDHIEIKNLPGGNSMIIDKSEIMSYPFTKSYAITQKWNECNLTIETYDRDESTQADTKIGTAYVKLNNSNAWIYDSLLQQWKPLGLSQMGRSQNPINK